MAKNYINNKDFYNALVKYLDEIETAKRKELPRPQVSEYLGDCFYQISVRLSTLPNFINYDFKDDLISDGIENCLVSILNFDPEKSKNPFAYFTQIVYNAFIRRITKEKKQMYLKGRVIEQSGVIEQLDDIKRDNPQAYEKLKEYLKKYTKAEE